MTLLRVRDLTVAFGERTVVDQVSFDVAAGERVAIIGESGSGKSLTCMAILGLLPGGASVSGSIRFEDDELLGRPEPELARIRGYRIGCVFQEPHTALNPVQRIAAQLTTAERLHGVLRRKDARAEAVRLAREVGLPEPERIVSRYPHELSGGQRQRVVIAMAMSCRPELLLADEPTTALDATVQARILDLMDAATAQRGTAVVMVTHDMAVAHRTSQRLLVMHGGRIVEQGPTADILRSPREAYTSRLVAAARASALVREGR